MYAEDPFRGFLPQAGLAEVVRWPSRARVDGALESGQRVGTFYDPMLGKVIAAGTTREAARRGLVSALDDTRDPRAHDATSASCGSWSTRTPSATARIDTGWLDAHPDEFALIDAGAGLVPGGLVGGGGAYGPTHASRSASATAGGWARPPPPYRSS